jgi:hypothetical protein
MAQSNQTKMEAPSAQQKPLRAFSWSYWVIIMLVSGTLMSYFIRRGGQLKAASITPTDIIDVRFGFFPSEAHQILRSLGPKGREIYKEMNKVDFIIAPIVFREVFLTTMPATSPQREIIRQFLVNVYFMGDVLENICAAIMLKIYPRDILSVAWIACAGNIMKNAGFGFAVMAILFEVYVWIRATKVKTQ